MLQFGQQRLENTDAAFSGATFSSAALAQPTKNEMARIVAPALAAVVPDRAAERAALVGSQVLGLATARYILCIPSLADMDDATLIEWLRPVLAHYLTGSVNPVDRP